MRINPINNTNNTINPNDTNFKSKIISNEFLKEGLKLAKKSIERSEIKSMNYAKTFLENIELIQLNKNAETVRFEINEAAKKAYVLEDKKIVSEMEYPERYNKGYVASQLINKYADSLDIEKRPTLTDKIKTELEIAYNDYLRAHERYQVHLDAILEDTSKNL